MRILRFWAYTFAALASMSLGVEVQRYLASEPGPVRALSDPLPGVSTRPADTLQSVIDWQPLSTQALWQQVAPGSLRWAEVAGREQVHEGVWNSVVMTLLGLPPAVWLGAAALLLFILARSRVGQPLPSPGGLRSLVRVGGLGLAAVGFGLVGADLLRSGGVWEPRSIETCWAALHAQSLESLGRTSFLASVLQWPAWLSAACAGALLAFLARPRSDLLMVAYPTAAVVRPRYLDVTRAYLDAVRPRGRRPVRESRGESPPLD